MRTLTCDAGHEWSHPGGRGRPPKACPEHRSPASQQAIIRHQSFYVPHPRPVLPEPAKLSAAERSALARRAALAKWSGVPIEERSNGARLAALAGHVKAGHSIGVAPVPVVELPCPFCGAVMHGVTRRQCGAAECRRKAQAERSRRHMHVRRARLLGNDWEPFDPLEVYDRDGWTCGICDLPVDPNLASPNPGSVSLDHIVPVSLHGPHTRENTRCSHLGCNMKRGNRAA